MQKVSVKVKPTAFSEEPDERTEKLQDVLGSDEEVDKFLKFNFERLSLELSNAIFHLSKMWEIELNQIVDKLQEEKNIENYKERYFTLAICSLKHCLRQMVELQNENED